MRFSRTIRDWKIGLLGDQRGITGLETAIILIAFVVVASVFAFAILNTGLLSSEKAKGAALGALADTESTLMLRGSIIGSSNPSNTALVTVRFQINPASGASGSIDLSTTTTVMSYQDDNQFVNLTAANWTATWLSGSGPLLDAGEAVDISIDLSGLTTALGQGQSFTVSVKPARGAVITITRTTPVELRPVVDLG